MIKESIVKKNKLPKDWQILPFGDVCEISGGSQPPKSTFIYDTKEGYIRLVQVRDYRTSKFITYIPKERAKKFCSKTDIMIGRYGPPIFGIFRGLEGAYNVALMKAIPNKELLNQEYLYWFLKTDSLVKFVEKSSKRAAGQDGVRKEVLYTYPTPIPPIPQQKSLVSTIIKAFTAIDIVKVNAKQNLQNAKELFESYLQNVFENKGDGWEIEKLGVLGKLTSSKRIYKKEYVSNGVPFYRSKEIKELSHNRKLSIELFISEQRYTEIKNKFGIPKEGDLLLTAVGTIGEMYIVKKGDEFYFKDGNIMWLKDFSNLNSYYLKYALTNFVERLKALSHGAAYSALTIEKLKEYSIPIPPIDEQKKIVQKLDALSTETKKLEAIYTQKIADLDEMKKSVLQKAFSGQLNTKK